MLTETPAILAFVAQTHPEARLAPLDDPFAFAEMQAFNSYLCATVHVAHAHRSAALAGPTSPRRRGMKRTVPETVGACFALIERKMLAARGRWASLTIADPYLFTSRHGSKRTASIRAISRRCTSTGRAWPSGPPCAAPSRARAWRRRGDVAPLLDEGGACCDLIEPASSPRAIASKDACPSGRAMAMQSKGA